MHAQECCSFVYIQKRLNISIDSNGGVSLVYVTENLIDIEDCVMETGHQERAVTIGVFAVSPEGAANSTDLHIYSGDSATPGPTIPDGNGGVLAAWQTTNQSLAMVSHLAAGGSASEWTFADLSFGIRDMVLGDNGVAFATDGYVVQSFNVNGSALWTWQGNGGIELVVAMPNGGVAMRNWQGSVPGDNSSPQDIVRLDATGNATYDQWGTSGAGSGYGIVSGVDYWVNSVWIGQGNGILEGLVGEPLQVATSAYPHQGGSRHKGKASPPPEVVMFLPSHLDVPVNYPQNDVPGFYDQMFGNSNANPPLAATVPSKNNIQNSPPKNQHAIANQISFDGASARISTFTTYPRKPMDAFAFIGHTTPPKTPSGLADQPFSVGLDFYYPSSKTSDCSAPENPGDPGPNPPNFDINAPWDTEYEKTFPGNNGLPYTLVQYFPCELNWGDHKLVSFEFDSTKVTGLSPSWDYINHFWTAAHPQLLQSTKLIPPGRVTFFAACDLNPSFAQPGEVPPFLQMWDIHDPSIDGATEDRFRSLIVPTYAIVNLGDGANQWVHILKHLVAGEAVGTAVENANNETGKTWKVIGNQNVMITSKK